MLCRFNQGLPHILSDLQHDLVLIHPTRVLKQQLHLDRVRARLLRDIQRRRDAAPAGGAHGVKDHEGGDDGQVQRGVREYTSEVGELGK